MAIYCEVRRSKLTMAIWIDDESFSSLRYLARSLERHGVRLVKHANIAEAKAHIEELKKGHILCQHVLLLDVILPKNDKGEALSPYLGLALAEFAAELGIRKICFLTVIPEREIDGSLKDLRLRFPKTEFRFEKKLELLEPGKIGEISEFLKSGECS
jgi:hypothetical protein